MKEIWHKEKLIAKVDDGAYIHINELDKDVEVRE